MRKASTPASLGELLGKAASKSKLSIEDLPELLGEKMPELPLNRVGKYRLLNALKLRFGNGYRNIPMIKDILNEFDSKVNDENIIRMNKKGRE